VPPGQKTESRQVRQEILHHWREAAPNDRFAHLVRDAGRSCVRALQIRLARESVSFGLWTFLRILWQTDGITQRDLSVRAGVMEPTAFTGLKALDKLGYITRKQAPNNKKNVYIHLTRKGRALRKKLEPLAEEVNRIAVRGVPPADVAATRKTLLAVIENLARDEIISAAKLRPLRARSNGIAWRKSLLRLGGLARQKSR
jgi:DNA-binding MarR family transcriptional regulator